MTSDFPTANEAGETALDIARLLNHTTCEDLVSNSWFNTNI